jgi:hypothetical protein
LSIFELANSFISPYVNCNVIIHLIINCNASMSYNACALEWFSIRAELSCSFIKINIHVFLAFVHRRSF